MTAAALVTVLGALREGRRLMVAVLAGATDDRVRVRSGAVAAALAFAQGDLGFAREQWRISSDLARHIDDPEGLPYAYGGIGLVALAEDDLDTAVAVFTETIGLTEVAGLGGEWLWTLSHVWLGTVELLRGDADRAAALVDDALAAGRRRHDPLAVYIALFTAIQVSVVRGDFARARSQIAEGVDDETWLWHLRRGDYERWFGDVIKDEALAAVAKRVANDPDADTSRREIIDAVSERYTLPAETSS